MPEREQEFPSTIPYFIYTLRLIVNVNDEAIQNPDGVGNVLTNRASVFVFDG